MLIPKGEKMLKSLLGIVSDIVDIADAVVSVPLAIVKPITGAIADGAKAVKEEVEDLLED